MSGSQTETQTRRKPCPLFPVSLLRNGKQGYLNIKENKPVEIFRNSQEVWVAQRSVGRTLLSDAFDLDLDFAENEQDVRSSVEERRFSAAISLIPKSAAERRQNAAHSLP